MPADKCSVQSLQRCKNYTKWKQSPVVRLRDWAARRRQFDGLRFFPPNVFQRMYFRTLWLAVRLCDKKRAPHALTPGEKIIVGLMLAGQYDRYPYHG